MGSSRTRMATTCIAVAVSGLAHFQALADLCPDAKTTPEMESCLSRELKVAEADLARYLEESNRMIGKEPEAIAALKTAQLAWEKYREAQCDAVYKQFSGGTLAGPSLLGCRLSLTQR